MKKHIPNFLTCCNLMVGAVGIVWLSLYQNPEDLILFVAAGAFFDLLDGMVARALRVQSSIGLQLDSLADLVSFGMLPAIGLFYYGYNETVWIHSPPEPTLLELVPLLVAVFSALRLAKFNVSTTQTEEFRGLPTPANAIMISGFMWLSWVSFDSLALALFTLFSCILLVSNIRMIALKFKTLGWKGNEIRYLFLALILTGTGIYGGQFLPFVIPTYIAFSIIGNYILQPVLFK